MKILSEHSLRAAIEHLNQAWSDVYDADPLRAEQLPLDPDDARRKALDARVSISNTITALNRLMSEHAS